MTERRDVENEERRRAKLHQILDLVLDINGLEPRDRKMTGNLPTVFMNLSGHVGWIEVEVYRNGWERDYSEADQERQTAYLYQGDGLDAIIRRLTEIKDEAQGAATPRASR